MAAQSKRLLTVEEALLKVLADVVPITDGHEADLLNAHGAVLLAPLLARHSQPPFDASAMDGYARGQRPRCQRHNRRGCCQQTCED